MFYEKMKQLLNIITPLHQRTQRNYIGRMNDDKIKCMGVAKRYEEDYWDGNRKYGYGGYRYDGRQEAIAKKLIENYSLKDGAKILDVGCGKGFLLYEFKKLLPNSKVIGFDISNHALKNAKAEVKERLFKYQAQNHLLMEDNQFDLVTSITTLHNLEINNLKGSLQEIERVGKEKYIVVESYRNDEELFNLQCWALTCNSFFSPKEWRWLFEEFKYKGDYEFIYFE